MIVDKGFPVEVGVLRQDLLLQSTKIGSRIDAEFVNQDRSRAAEGPECICLTPRPVEREQQLSLQTLTERVLVDQAAQLAGEFPMATQYEQNIVAFLQRGQSHLFEPCCLTDHEWFTKHVGIGRALPQPECRLIQVE